MERWYTFVVFYLWIAPHILLAFVSLMLYLRRLHRTFPLFFVYTVVETCQFLVLFSIRMTYPHAIAYQYVFMVSLAVSAALRFGIVQEIFNSVFHEYPRLELVATICMRCLVGVLILASVLAAVYASGNVFEDSIAGIALLDRSVAIVQVGLLLFILVFSWMFGLSWRPFPCGMALGFGILASSDLAIWALRLSSSAAPFVRTLNLLLTGAFHITVLVWLGYLLKAEKPVGAASYSTIEINRWTGELERPLR